MADIENLSQQMEGSNLRFVTIKAPEDKDGVAEDVRCDIPRGIADEINGMSTQAQLNATLSNRGGADHSIILFYELDSTKLTAENGWKNITVQKKAG